MSKRTTEIASLPTEKSIIIMIMGINAKIVTSVTNKISLMKSKSKKRNNSECTWSKRQNSLNFQRKRRIMNNCPFLKSPPQHLTPTTKWWNAIHDTANTWPVACCTAGMWFRKMWMPLLPTSRQNAKFSSLTGVRQASKLALTTSRLLLYLVSCNYMYTGVVQNFTCLQMNFLHPFSLSVKKIGIYLSSLVYFA